MGIKVMKVDIDPKQFELRDTGNFQAAWRESRKMLETKKANYNPEFKFLSVSLLSKFREMDAICNS